MLKRREYLDLIEEIRNTEEKSLDTFIEKVLDPLRKDNPRLIETLYKDINYLLKGIEKEGEGDLCIENGDFVTENGDLKITGYQSRLHVISNYLHVEIAYKLINSNSLNISREMEEFEKNINERPNYTPEYKSSLDKIKKSLKEERRQNLGEKENFWNKVWDTDNLELKPNIAGLGINFNEIIKKFKKN
ncbi:hypothetical protein Q4517_00530 [Tenacibaculum sp. 1_MG-2023]|uniref:hypothetical protein n=1 Tax=Tenacibaculum sp. 1_MG-2023 TaxID=3062653 RepID=UPI0026E30C65|nr:hypothetical protein [Tenacibaculum sp. 1_MG-2023]MDO6674033.1 hypothetical protein [Tenacibaculum sp. 1_MG-2023]